MLKNYLLFNPYTGAYAKYETLPELIQAKQDLINLKVKELDDLIKFQCEVENKDGDIVILQVNIDGDIYAELPEPFTSQQLIDMYGRELTELEQAAWNEYNQLISEIPKQEGYPFNIIWPIQPDLVPR